MDLKAKFRNYTPAMVDYALRDIRETLTIWRDEDTPDNAYTRKLWAEWDHLIAMKHGGAR